MAVKYKKKIVNLGVPYFTFSLITWLLKTAFSGSVNTQIGGSLFEMLFLHPTAPYWYLYALFFLFLVTPTLSSKVETVVALIIALLFKAFEVFGGGCGIQAISYILSNEIWFVIGMCLSVFDFRSYMVKKRLGIPILLGIGFLILSVFVYVMDINFSGMGFFLGLSACCAVIAIVEERYKKNKQSLMFGILAKYTMPIFLMHTIFAAGLRMILLKIGIQNALIHIVLGLSISFAGPMAAAIVMKKSKWLEFFIYPSKFIKIK